MGLHEGSLGIDGPASTKPGFPLSSHILATSSVDLGIDFSEMQVMEQARDGGRDG
jgi:hypothetical protein